MVVISPHLDDAVFSCGAMLAASPGSHVITVFAGTPDDPAQCTDWDARCGFANAAQAMAQRRQEDEAALAMLDAKPVWLPFTDSQYGQHASPKAMAAALRSALEDVVGQHPGEDVLLPMGLFHADHLTAHDASVQALAGMASAPALLVYEDVPYREKEGLVQNRLGVLAAEGLVATPVHPRQDKDPSRKQRAVRAYASQLGPLGPLIHHRLEQPERVWLLAHGSF